ncbi:MAG TPA: aminotransferase class V-fold PLP-dependent enzyme [Syntrophobacteraceae bacterium]|nr:aminotransferase class V-fold PLP-dependent enzyme [Syntrophobacteraceae bacterium]
MPVYLDNAATSFPKPKAVVEAVGHVLEGVGASPGRGSHKHAAEAMTIVSECRQKAATIFGVKDPDRVVFTKNATEGINVVLKGWLRPGDRVLYSAMEHNSVVRPLWRLASQGVNIEMIPCSPSGVLDLEILSQMLHEETRLVVLVHVSNVNGALMPLEEVARLCSRAGTPLFLDAAQSAGLQPIEAEQLGIGMLACSGHKALLGPAGVGILYVRPDLDVLPLIEGGTGSRSDEFEQPEFCPDRYESGTPNLPGLAGLREGIGYILQTGMNRIRNHEIGLAHHIESELWRIPGVRVFEPEKRGSGTVSFVVEQMNPADTGSILDQAFDIAVRTGLHCAPLAHRTIGTFPAGTVRVSPGFSTNIENIEYFINGLRWIVTRRG